MKLRNAPYLNKQDDNPFNELYIIAGSDAFNKERLAQIILFTQAENNLQPIILNSERLAEIDRLQIAPENKRYISIFKSGDLSEKEKNAICLNIAKHTKAEIISFVDEAMQRENVSDYINRIRNGETMAEKVAEMTAKPSQDKKQPYKRDKRALPYYPEIRQCNRRAIKRSRTMVI